jgi:hypothetical protein
VLLSLPNGWASAMIYRLKEDLTFTRTESL